MLRTRVKRLEALMESKACKADMDSLWRAYWDQQEILNLLLDHLNLDVVQHPAKKSLIKTGKN